jgi:hypothetical protein
LKTNHFSANRSVFRENKVL